MFLDICCFFLYDVYGERLSIDHGCSKLLTYEESALVKAFEMLIHRSLFEVHNGTLQMHDQLQDMGRKIVEWKIHGQHGCSVGETKYAGTCLHHLGLREFEQMKTKVRVFDGFAKNFNFGNVEGISCEVLRDNASLEKLLMGGACPKLRILLIQTDLKKVPLSFTKLTSLTTLELSAA